MPERLSIPIILSLIVVVVAGCFTTQYTIPSEQPRSNYDVVGSFETKQRASWLIMGLVSLRPAEVEEIVAREVNRYDGDAATNVRVTAQYDATDIIVSLIVGGLYNTRSYRVTGDVVNFKSGTASLPGPSAKDSRIVGVVQYDREFF